MSTKHNNESGAVSIFVVVFAAIFITIVTVGFVQAMLKGQQEAAVIDLSQSAYDSAMAGVEDAKRALRSPEVVSALDDIGFTKTCRTVPDIMANGSRAGSGGKSGPETMIQTSEEADGNDLDQAYTCLMIDMETDDVQSSLESDSQAIVPLKTVGGAAAKSVTVRWFDQEDASAGGGSGLATPVKLESGSLDSGLPPRDKWQSSTPPVMEVQLIQLTDGPLSDFDGDDIAKNNSHTLNLYPVATVDTTPTSGLNFSSDIRKSSSSKVLTPVKCQSTIGALEAWGNYSCQATIDIPSGSDTDPVQFLRLASHYNRSSYQILMFDGTSSLKFNGVQPAVDSTGRANDMFRRVRARMSRSLNAIYPEAAVDITGSLCKTMTVTGREDDYSAGTCDPSVAP